MHFTDIGDRYRLRLANGVLTYSTAAHTDAPDASVTLPQASLPTLVAGAGDRATLTAAGVDVSGDASALDRLFGVLDSGDPDFAVVTPERD